MEQSAIATAHAPTTRMLPTGQGAARAEVDAAVALPEVLVPEIATCMEGTLTDAASLAFPERGGPETGRQARWIIGRALL